MKVFLATLCLLWAAVPVAHAAPLFTADRACACDPKVSDPLEEPVRFAFGKFDGQCVDSCRFRRGRVLPGGGEHELVVGNVLHLGKYVEARIPLDRVESVQAGFERFAPAVDHVLLRFTFTGDVPLFRQQGRHERVGSTRAIVISSEGVPPKGHRYSMSEGYWGYYLLAHRLVTGEELDHWLTKLKHPLRLASLRLGGASAARILERGIRRSDAESFGSAYELFANNCSTSALALLDGETGYHESGWDPLHWRELEAALPIAGPIGTERALRTRGLLGPDGASFPARAEARP